LYSPSLSGAASDAETVPGSPPSPPASPTPPGSPSSPRVSPTTLISAAPPLEPQLDPMDTPMLDLIDDCFAEEDRLARQARDH